MGKQSKYFISNDNLIKIRKSVGLVQKEFSFMLGIKRSLLGAYEEHRAEVTTNVIRTCIKRKWLSAEQLYDFMFNKKFIPTPQKKYERVWVEQAIEEMKTQIKNKK